MKLKFKEAKRIKGQIETSGILISDLMIKQLLFLVLFYT